MNNDKTSYFIIIILFVILVLFGWLCVDNVKGRREIVYTNYVVKHARQKTKLQKSIYRFKLNTVQHKVFHNASNSKNSIIRSYSRDNNNHNLVDGTSTAAFTQFFQYSDHDDYILRASRDKNYFTSNVLKNKHYFNDDLDSSGHSIIQAEGNIHSKMDNCNTYIISVSGNNIYSVVDVTYDAWKDGSPAGTGEIWYYMTYNTKLRKFTRMSTMFTEKDISNTDNVAADGNQIPTD